MVESTTAVVAPAPDDAPWRMLDDVVQEGQVTLATVDDERLPDDWHRLSEILITSLDRYSVHLSHVPVRRVGETRLVVVDLDDCTVVGTRTP